MSRLPLSLNHCLERALVHFIHLWAWTVGLFDDLSIARDVCVFDDPRWVVCGKVYALLVRFRDKHQVTPKQTASWGLAFARRCLKTPWILPRYRRRRRRKSWCFWMTLPHRIAPNCSPSSFQKCCFSLFTKILLQILELHPVALFVRFQWRNVLQMAELH